MDRHGRAGQERPDGRVVTWRLVVPPSWGTRGDPKWLPRNGGEGWRRLFASEDMAGQVLREEGRSLPWKTLAECTALLAGVLPHYRVQLRIAEFEAAHCEHAEAHLAALAAGGAGAEPLRRTHPPGPWRLLTLGAGGSGSALVAGYPSVDGAEGDAAARRVGDAGLVYWAAPAFGAAPAAATTGSQAGWVPLIDGAVRRASFAAEDAVVALCASAAERATGPDTLDAGLLCLLGESAWRSIHEYRTLLAAAWDDIEACPHDPMHEERAAEAIFASTHPDADGPGGPWRHVTLLDRGNGPEGAEIATHAGYAGASAAVAAARATDEDAIHWAEPVAAGVRPPLPGGRPL